MQPQPATHRPRIVLRYGRCASDPLAALTMEAAHVRRRASDLIRAAPLPDDAPAGHPRAPELRELSEQIGLMTQPEVNSLWQVK